MELTVPVWPGAVDVVEGDWEPQGEYGQPGVQEENEKL